MVARLRIVGQDLPGTRFHDAERVHVGIQRRRDAVDLVPGDAHEAVFDAEIDLRPGRDGGIDAFGPHVQGRPGKRFVYLTWGDVDENGRFEMFRRLKLWLDDDAMDALERGAGSDKRVEGHLGLTDCRGGPVCGGSKPGLVRWQVV